MDPTRKLSVVTFKDVRLSAAAVMGELHQGWMPLQRILQRANVALAAECVGGANRAVEIATTLKEWIQAGEFLLSEPVAPLPGVGSDYDFKPLKERPIRH